MNTPNKVVTTTTGMTRVSYGAPVIAHEIYAPGAGPLRPHVVGTVPHKSLALRFPWGQ